MDPIPPGKPVSDDELASELSIVSKSIVHHLVKNGTQYDVARDAAAAGVLKAYMKAHLWKGKAKLRTFLQCVAKRAAIDFLRKENTQSKVKRCVLEESEIDSMRLRYSSRSKLANLSELDKRGKS